MTDKPQTTKDGVLVALDFHKRALIEMRDRLNEEIELVIQLEIDIINKENWS